MGRYRIEVPNLSYREDGHVDIFCSADSADWSALTWGRWGSGGKYTARHLFVDDWRIEHTWRKQGEGIAKALLCEVVTAPDFTIDGHFPLPLASYQVWRSRVIGRLWQDYGATVVPVLQWGKSQTWSLCASGIKQDSVVAVRGPQQGTEKEWQAALDFMLNRIKPALVLHFGRHVDYPAGVACHYYPLRRGIGNELR